MDYEKFAIEQFEKIFKKEPDYKYEGYYMIEDYALRMKYKYKDKSYSITFKVNY